MNIFNCAAASLILTFHLVSPVSAQEDPALFLDRANAKVAKAMVFRNQWDGPVSAPAMREKGLIVFIGSDFRDNGVTGIANGVKEAAMVIGWRLQMIDCYNLPSRRPEAFSRAIALRPDAIILAGIDARAQPKELAAAAKQKIPVIGWHAAAKIGPADGLFTNLGTEPKEAGQIAALLSIVESRGKAGVVVFSDAASSYATAKASAIIDTIKQCQTCALLAVEQFPPLEVGNRYQVIDALAKRLGVRWTHTLGTSDQYFDPPKAAAAMPAAGSNRPPQTIAAGDGSVAAFQRIRDKTQIGTVPEPLNMQGWQLVDEAGRAIAGQKPSGYAPSTYLATSQNHAFHGGSKSMFDPDNGYRDAYRKIWGK
ncbi:MAG TPA: substrate-binding domain-containing protein [Burkholderiaceae bacterium]|nr:substrate-binding domain-containing protein [Burkholderiaceae bacterium]